ncbi:MAG: hypothetical protein WCH34_15890 [Bacteroidota bacterium]
MIVFVWDYWDIGDGWGHWDNGGAVCFKISCEIDNCNLSDVWSGIDNSAFGHWIFYLKLIERGGNVYSVFIFIILMVMSCLAECVFEYKIGLE